MTVDWSALCPGCSHTWHEPGECGREIQTHTKPPTWQDCPCIYQRRHP